MNLLVFTPVRLLGDGLAASLASRRGVDVRAVVNAFADLHAAIQAHDVDLMLIDVTQGIDLSEVRAIAQAHPDILLVALGLDEQRQNVIRCGRAGFTGYVPRDASIEELCNALSDVVHGRLACPAEISCGLLRALFRMNESPDDPGVTGKQLSRRECDVMHLIERGLSNKEIARELCLSVSTVKHHVHHILEKLELSRRTQAMHRAREEPWIAQPEAVKHLEDRGRAP
ncbi:response regulator transcription factor [Lysobacter sp. MMG2]|uniref:LuxR C-terminal-related transcriptional regulator n=1 Tax=Lysobacter sp. MMG2 TaxID=2801338 RepID=UPI001C2305AF|nr:response regulator transcription factor [Lysobacter sp. MMG2]MBU8974524.1 response regulator transcription factor [Lysobacter sp. MMG2]